jgi:hypothetical protein
MSNYAPCDVEGAEEMTVSEITASTKDALTASGLTDDRRVALVQDDKRRRRGLAQLTDILGREKAEAVKVPYLPA